VLFESCSENFYPFLELADRSFLFLNFTVRFEEQDATITQLKKDFRATVAQQQKQIEALTAGLQKG